MTSANKSLNMAKAYSFLKCRLENLFDFHCNLLICCLIVNFDRPCTAWSNNLAIVITPPTTPHS